MPEKVFGFIKKNKSFEPTKKVGCWVFADELVLVVTIEWMEKETKKILEMFDADAYNTYDAERGFDELLSAAKKEAEK